MGAQAVYRDPEGDDIRPCWAVVEGGKVLARFHMEVGTGAFGDTVAAPELIRAKLLAESAAEELRTAGVTRERARMRLEAEAGREIGAG